MHVSISVKMSIKRSPASNGTSRQQTKWRLKSWTWNFQICYVYQYYRRTNRTHQIRNLRCFSPRLAFVFVQSIEARCKVAKWRVINNFVYAIFKHAMLFQRVDDIATRLGFTHKHLGTNGCVFSTLATDTLVLQHQAISINCMDQIYFAFDQFHTKIWHLHRKNNFNKIYPSGARLWKIWIPNVKSIAEC